VLRNLLFSLLLSTFSGILLAAAPPASPGGESSMLVLHLDASRAAFDGARLVPMNSALAAVQNEASATTRVLFVNADGTSAVRVYMVAQHDGDASVEVAMPFSREWEFESLLLLGAPVPGENSPALALRFSSLPGLVMKSLDKLSSQYDSAETARRLREALQRELPPSDFSEREGGGGLAGAYGRTYCVNWMMNAGDPLNSRQCSTCYSCVSIFGFEYCDDPSTNCNGPEIRQGPFLGNP
jgi:hypothetical protein